MTQREADSYIIGYWETAAKENDERATQLESLAGKSLDVARGNFMAMEAFETWDAEPQRLKAANENKVLIAALKHCAAQNQIFPAACEAVPFHKPSSTNASSISLAAGARLPGRRRRGRVRGGGGEGRRGGWCGRG